MYAFTIVLISVLRTAATALLTIETRWSPLLFNLWHGI